MTNMRIRRATPADAEAIARLNVAAWREAYVWLMPREALDRLDVVEQAARWRDVFRADDSGAVFLATQPDGRPCGYASCCRQRGPSLAAAGFSGEFAALYVLQRAQRQGLGRALAGAMAAHLISTGHSRASVWVFRDNAGARSFYEALGARKTEIDGEWDILGVTLADMSYGWSDISALAAGAPAVDG